MKPDKEIRICDLCNEYYAVYLDAPDYEITYLNKKLDLCHNCYNIVTNTIQSRKKRSSKNVEYLD